MTLTHRYLKAGTVQRTYTYSSFLRLVLLLQLSIHLGNTGNNIIEHKHGCICPGYNVTYQCTVCDDDRYPGATTWTGSLFDCGNGITLRHSRFESGTVGECNNGEVIARSIEVMDTVKGSRCYVSQLNFIASRDHNNETIMCEYVSSMDVTVVDEIIILFETDPIPPPSNIHISEISPLVLKLSWNQSSFFCQYIITSMAIGSNSVCSNTTKFFIDTTYFMLYTNVFTIGHNCSFSVETVVCGNITGGKSVPLLVTFKVPDPPLFAPSSNYYSPKDKLIYTGFYISDPFNISDGVDGSAMFYTVTYTDTVSNSSCHSATLPASNCIGGVCYNNYSIQSSSVDSFTACSIHSPSIAVRVSAGNVLGNSSESMPIYISIVSDTAKIDNRPDTIISVSVSVGITIIIILVTIMTVIAAARMVSFRKKHNSCNASGHVYVTPNRSHHLPSQSRNFNTSAEQGSGPLYADVGPFIKDTSTSLSQFLDDDQVEYAQIKQPPEVSDTKVEVNRQTCYAAIDKFLNLDNLLIQLRPHVTPKWYEFGVAIGVAKEVLERCLGYPPEECIVEVLDNWLRTSTPKPTWRDVAEGLCKIGFQKQAESILKVYETGTLPISIESETCIDIPSRPQRDDTGTIIDAEECPPPIPPKKL